MKNRIISVITVLCMLFLVGTLPASAEQNYEEPAQPAYIGTSVTEISGSNTATVSVYVETGEPLDLTGIELAVWFDRRNFTCKSVKNGTLFSNSQSAAYGDELRFNWEGSSNITLPEGSTTLFTAVFEADEDAADGNYDFYLYCNEFYSFDLDTGKFKDIKYDCVSQFSWWKGERFEILPDRMTLPVGASQPILANKSVAYWMSSNPSVASVDSEGNVTGLRTGTAVIWAHGGVNDSEISTCRVTVTEPKVYLMTVKKQPNITEYFAGESIDLTGLELTVSYDNYQTETVTGGFTAEYDFSTVGEKTVKIIYKNSYVTINVTVLPLTGINIIPNTFEKSNGLIYKIPSGTTAEQLLNAVREKRLVKIMSGGEEVTDGTVTTGMRAVLSVGGNVIETAEIAVSGDINGDGEVNILDLIRLKKIVANVVNPAKTEIAAATDSVTGTSVTAADLVNMKRRLIGVE